MLPSLSRILVEAISMYEISSWTDNSDFMGQKGIKNRKSEHHLWTLHIRISPGIKFHLKLVIWFFGPNLPKKGISRRTPEKVNGIIEFCIFELD